MPDSLPPVEVELIQQEDAQQGAATAESSQPPPAAASPAQNEAAGTISPPPSPPAPPRQTTAPAVNLGNAEQDLEGLTVSGENIVPPAVDAVFRNRPPTYPPEAARRGIQGTVKLLVRVSAIGSPDLVSVVGSSGTASLDRAARDAVMLWRFRPAHARGVAVPYDYELNIRFTTGDR